MRTRLRAGCVLMVIAVGGAGCGTALPQPADQVLPGAWEHTDSFSDSQRTVWRLELKPDHQFTRTVANTPADANGQSIAGTWAAIDPAPPSWARARLIQVGLASAPVTVPFISLTLEYSVPKGAELPAGATVVEHSGVVASAQESNAPASQRVRERYLASVRTDGTGKVGLHLTTEDALRNAARGVTRPPGGPASLNPPDTFVRLP